MQQEKSLALISHHSHQNCGDPSHPTHGVLTVLSSGKSYTSICAKSTRLLNSLSSRLWQLWTHCLLLPNTISLSSHKTKKHTNHMTEKYPNTCTLQLIVFTLDKGHVKMLHTVACQSVRFPLKPGTCLFFYSQSDFYLIYWYWISVLDMYILNILTSFYCHFIIYFIIHFYVTLWA